MRRTAWLQVLALVIAVAACGEDSSTDSSTGAAGSGGTSIQVTGTSGSTPDAPPATTVVEPAVYKVMSGDSVFGIAARFCTSGAELASVNSWGEGVGHSIHPGDEILVPGNVCLAQTGGQSTEPGPSSTSIDPSRSEPPMSDQAPNSSARSASELSAVLSGDGLGVVSFGASTDEMTATMRSAFGEPTSDLTTHWSGGVPVADPGSDSMGTSSQSWNQPVSRTICWGANDGLCIFLGGPSDDGLSFVGWRMLEPVVTMSDGLGIGSLVSEFPALVETLRPETCTTAWGEHSGVRVLVRAQGVPFLTIDADGHEIPQGPDPSSLVVARMEAGYIGDNDGPVCS